jgi:hypothetical protein
MYAALVQGITESWLALVLPLLIALMWAAAVYFFKVVPVSAVTEWKVCTTNKFIIITSREGGGREGERERGREGGEGGREGGRK